MTNKNSSWLIILFPNSVLLKPAVSESKTKPDSAYQSIVAYTIKIKSTATKSKFETKGEGQ
jgi:hypothetical protein